MMKKIESRLREKFPMSKDRILYWQDRGFDYFFVPSWELFEAVSLLKSEFGFDLLMDLFCVDYLNYPTPLPDFMRFETVACLYSTSANRRIFIKSYYPAEAPEADSLVPLYAGANWFEREIFDMFGVRFKNHPDLRRILMYESFEGHPLRKDYDIKKRQPLIGPKN